MRSLIAVVASSCFVLEVLLGPGAVLAQTCDDAGDIPFKVVAIAPEVGDDRCISCQGPWSRFSNLTPVPLIRNAIKSNGACQFYAANHVAGFQPYGDWICSITFCSGSEDIGAGFLCLKSTDSAVTLDVRKSDQGDFFILFNGVGESTCTSQSLKSTLAGDDAGERDQDDFAFRGQPGDSVLVTVAADNKSGHNGGKLIVGSGVNPDLKNKGTLPLTLTDTIPASGDYLVVVKQVGDAPKRFKGTYHVSVQSQTGQRIQQTAPLASLE